MNEQEIPPITKGGQKTAIDLATIAGSCVLGFMAAANPVTAGIGAAVLFPVAAYSSMSLLGRYLFNDHAAGRMLGNQTGLGLSWNAGKSIVSDRKSLVGALIYFGVVSVPIGMASYEFREQEAENKARQAELAAMPILPLDTIIKTETTTAADLCRGRRAGTQVLQMHSNTKYKIVCP